MIRARVKGGECGEGRAAPDLFLRRRAELFGFACRESGRHVQRLHHFIIAEALVLLKIGHEVVGEGDHSLDAVTHLTVAQVLEEVTHLSTHTPFSFTSQQYTGHYRRKLHYI